VKNTARNGKIVLKMEVYEVLRQKLLDLAQKKHLLGTRILVRARVLSAEEAIGDPGRSDFPLQRGKESLIEAQFEGARGQAFTDHPGNFTGTLGEVLKLPLHDNYQRALFVATLNAFLRHLGEIQGTVHCRDEGPNLCAQELVRYLKKRFGKVRLGMVGLQPAMVEVCSRYFPLRVLDLDPENIGREKFGIIIEDGYAKAKELKEWAQVLLITGSTLTNGTITEWLNTSCPTIFYGVTIAGASYLLNLPRFCPFSG
jgi:hypothetical protein